MPPTVGRAGRFFPSQPCWGLAGRSGGGPRVGLTALSDQATRRGALSDTGSTVNGAPCRGATVWLTGRPASGKTTVGAALAIRLVALGYRPHLLDGDELRRTVCSDLGFSRVDRAENVRRASRYALESALGGQVVVCSLVSPYAVDRQRVRALHESAGVLFVEVHVDCPLAVAEARDPKGHYRRARAGELAGFTGLGVDAPYEPPDAPEVVLDTGRMAVEEAAQHLLECLKVRFAAAALAGRPGPRPLT